MINAQEVLVANGAGILILAVSFLSEVKFKKEKHLSNKLFKAISLLAFFALMAETATFLLDGTPGGVAHFLQYLLNAYLFLASGGVGALWVLYVNVRIYHSKKRFRRWLLPTLLPYGVIVLLIICDLCGTGLIFSVSEQNVYQRGQWVVLQYLILICDYAVSLIQALVAVRQNHHPRFFPVHYFVLPCVFGTLIQICFYGLATGWFSVSLALQFIRLHIAEENAFVDELSGLYNRKYYNGVIRKLEKSRKNRTIAGVLMDIDQFKAINDVWGHFAGDEAIRSLGRILSGVATEKTMAFRLAGDEFVLLDANGTEEGAERLMQTVRESVERFNDSADKPYRLSLSMGYTLCNTENFDPNAFLHEMDRHMYSQKAERYERQGIPPAQPFPEPQEKAGC